MANNPNFPAGSSVYRVKLFSALATHRVDSTVVDRHRVLNRALIQSGVEIELGAFKKADRICRAECKKNFYTFEEKKSDINLAMGVIESFIVDDVDCAVIVSGDTDQVATIEAVKRLFSGKKVGVIQPAFRQNNDLRLSAHFYSELRPEHYEKHQLPDKVVLSNGKTITKPKAW